VLKRTTFILYATLAGGGICNVTNAFSCTATGDTRAVRKEAMRFLGHVGRREGVSVNLRRDADAARRTTIRRGEDEDEGQNLYVDRSRSRANLKNRVACVYAMALLVVCTVPVIVVAEPDAAALFTRVSPDDRVLLEVKPCLRSIMRG
jgi:hypothetical protein